MLEATLSNSLLSSAVIAVIVVIVSGYVVSYSVDIDTVADIIFAGMLNAAYATQGALNLTPAGNINYTSGSQDLESSTEIVIFESGTGTYAAILAGEEEDVVRILDVTNPYNITAAGIITNNATLVLGDSVGIAIFNSGNHTYAAVAANKDHGVQILNVTNPYNITAAGSITNSTSPILVDLLDITTFKSDGRTYAAVLSADFDVQILDVTYPPNIAVAGNKTTSLLRGGQAITTFESGDDIYAVAANIQNSVQILKVTDPSDIAVAGNITTFTLSGVQDITTFKSGNHTYAAVTSVSSVSNLSILNVTDPYDITAAGSIEDDDDLKFKNPFGVAIFKLGSKIYAAVTGSDDDGVQMLDVTDPSRITPAGSIDKLTYPDLKLDRAWGITTFESGNHTYAAVTADTDHGVQIIKIAKVDPDPPVIKLNGTASVTIEAYDEYMDEGATCSDVVDEEDITLTSVSTVDITRVGNYTVTYSCMDTSGNNAVPVSRTVMVKDTTPPVITLNCPAMFLNCPTTVQVIQDGPYHEYGAVCSDMVDGEWYIDPDSDTVVTGTPGPYILTYNCKDKSENSADQVTRTVEVVGMLDLTTPADVTSANANGTYGPGDIVDVRINFTQPVSLEAFVIRDDNPTNPSPFKELDGSISVTTIMIDSKHYALVASFRDDGVQIINITDPSSPTAVANVTDSTEANPTEYTELDGAYSVTTTQIQVNGTEGHYALVASRVDNGVQIIDITDPSRPSAVADITDCDTDCKATDYTELEGAISVTTTTIGSNHYALVASVIDDGVQIIDITDPSRPSAVANITDGGSDGNGVTFDVLKGANSVTTTTIDSMHYALVVSQGDNGVQIIDITDPSRPSAVANATDNTTENPTDYTELNGAYSVTTTTIGSNHYALVASTGIGSDNGVQIINITTPSSPTAVVANITDGGSDGNGGTFDMLRYSQSVTTTTIPVNGADRHYALVAAFFDRGVQIIDITDPSRPTAVSSMADSTEENPTNYSELQGATSVTTTQIGSRHYALVASLGDNGVQMIDITEPARPLNSLLPYVVLDLVGDRRAAYAVMQDGKSLAFEYLVGPVDWTTDLAYLENRRPQPRAQHPD